MDRYDVTEIMTEDVAPFECEARSFRHAAKQMVQREIDRHWEEVEACQTWDSAFGWGGHISARVLVKNRRTQKEKVFVPYARRGRLCFRDWDYSDGIYNLTSAVNEAVKFNSWERPKRVDRLLEFLGKQLPGMMLSKAAHMGQGLEHVSQLLSLGAKQSYANSPELVETILNRYGSPFVELKIEGMGDIENLIGWSQERHAVFLRYYGSYRQHAENVVLDRM